MILIMTICVGGDTGLELTSFQSYRNARDISKPADNAHPEIRL